MTEEHRPRVLISAERIAARVRELAQTIERDYAGRTPILVCVLKGGLIFAADLARAIHLPLRIEFLGMQSYGNSTRSTGVVQITQDLTIPVEGEDVILVEDIVDTGLTSAYLLNHLKARRPSSLKLCVLLHKPARSIQQVDIAYLGFTVEDEFVVGYGLDWAQRFRNLPDLCVLEPSPE
jgi:hypoxanthine phosphoribosyltransferase